MRGATKAKSSGSPPGRRASGCRTTSLLTVETGDPKAPTNQWLAGIRIRTSPWTIAARVSFSPSRFSLRKFQPQDTVAPHEHHFIQLVHVFTGRLQCRVGQQTWTLGNDDRSLLLLPETPHAWQALETTDCLLLDVEAVGSGRRIWLGMARERWRQGVLCKALPDADLWDDRLRCLLAENQASLWNARVIGVLLQLWWSRMMGWILSPPDTPHSPEQSPPTTALTDFDRLARQAEDLIEANYARTDFNTAELTRRLEIDRQQLQRLFQQYWPCENWRYGPERRLESVRVLKSLYIFYLTPQLSVKEVARSAGFANTQYFIKCWKRQFKRTPKNRFYGYDRQLDNKNLAWPFSGTVHRRPAKRQTAGQFTLPADWQKLVNQPRVDILPDISKKFPLKSCSFVNRRLYNSDHAAGHIFTIDPTAFCMWSARIFSDGGLMVENWPPDRQFPPCEHDYLKIIYLLSGRMLISGERQRVMLEPGQNGVLILPGVTHAIRNLAETFTIVARLDIMGRRRQWLLAAARRQAHGRLLPFADRHVAAWTGQMLPLLAEREKDEWRNLVIGSFAYLWITQALRMTLDWPRVSRQGRILSSAEPLDGNIHRTFQQASVWIYRNWQRRNAGLDVMARELGLNLKRIERAVKTYLGITVVEYLCDTRLNIALELMMHDHDVSLKQVAYGCGFSSPNSFARCFQHKFKRSPSSFCRRP